jgi:hypothetical protein
MHPRYCGDEDRALWCWVVWMTGRAVGGGRHHFIVNHVVVLEEVIYSPAIAALHCCAEFHYAGVVFWLCRSV